MAGTRGGSGGDTAPGLRGGGLAFATLAVVCWPWALSWQATFGGVAFAAWPHLGLLGFALASSGCGLLWLRARGRQRGEGPDGDRPRRPVEVVLALLAIALASASLGWDGWWHARGGTASHFLTPPHALAALAALAVLAQWTWALRREARSGGESGEHGLRTPGAALLGGLVLLWVTTLGTELLGRPNLWRGSEFYVASAAALPAVLVAYGRASDARLGATLASLVHLAAVLGLYAMLWFPSPASVAGGSGPVPARFVLPQVPLLLVAPALGLDGLLALTVRFRGLVGRTLEAGLLGGAFVALLLVAHWPVAAVLVPRMGSAPLARAWPSDAGAAGFRTEYWNLDPGTVSLAEGLLVAAGLATLSCGVGLWLGRRMRRPTGGRPPGV